MYLDNAYCEFYPTEIVDKILREYPDASVEQKNQLMQAEWDAIKPESKSMARLADELGL